MASEIDPFSMLEVSFSVLEVPEIASLGVDRFHLEASKKKPQTKMVGDVDSLETIGISEDSPYLVPLNIGWKREVVLRVNSSSSNRADIYYVPPQGRRCRSLKDVEKAIGDTDLTLENFSFSKKILGVNDPDKEFIRSAKEISMLKRASLQQSPEKVDSLPKKAKVTHKHTKVKPKPEIVEFEADETEKTSLDVSSGLENAETDDKEVTDSTNVISSLNLTRSFSSPINEADPLPNESTSYIRTEPSSATNIPSSTTSEHDPLDAPLQVSLRCCSCDMCSAVDDKSVCCWEIGNVQAVKSDYQCITHHPGFEKLILDSDVLSITRHLLSIKTKNKNKKSLLNTNTPLNITWRYIAYKQFVSWINCCTAIGSRNPVAIPSCVVNAVREKYPEQNGSYKILKFSA